MRLLVLTRLAARSVGRNARRSVLTASAMALGLALLVFSRALADGGHEQWIDSAVRLGAGHLGVHAPGYLRSGRLSDRLAAEDVAAIETVLSQAPLAGQVEAATVRLSVEGLASSAASALPVRVDGVDPRTEPRFSGLAERLTEGSYLGADARLEAVVGSELARRLDVGIGHRFVLTAQGVDGQVQGQLVRVAGVVRTGIPEMDASLVHIPLETARAWLRAPGEATLVGVLLPSSRATDASAATLRERLGARPGVRVHGWRETSPELDSAVRIDDYGDYVFHSILFAIVALAILNTILMSVLGRRREFGVLQALGLTRLQTGAVVFAEGLFLTAASGVVGLALGISVTWGIWGDGLDLSGLMETDQSLGGGVIEPVIVPAFHPEQLVLSLTFIAIVGTLASLYPAWRASRLDVADALKFEQ